MQSRLRQEVTPSRPDTRRLIPILLALSTFTPQLHPETGHAAWLRYSPPAHPTPDSPAIIVTFENDPQILSARDELARGLRDMFHRTLRCETQLSAENTFVLATIPALARQVPQLPSQQNEPNSPPESFRLHTITTAGHRYTLITSPTPSGVLYGTFALLRRLLQNEANLATLDHSEQPQVPLRWVNEWDNLNGTIERGYGGRSIFFDNDQVRADLSQASAYARLLASLGINGCAINNVNADPRILSPTFLPQLVRIAQVFRPWGVHLVLSVDFGSPKTIGDLDTFDPLDPRVAAFWQNEANQLYAAIPDLGGFVLKADSEGRVGPSVYHRTHADAANVVARALKPHGGWLFYRGFVYDHHMDWRNLKNDRARAAYDNFQPLDGQFDENVVVQIKNGPIDFQVREPVSPLFAALQKTNQALELQITQEYFGQARHTVYLVPMWKEILASPILANLLPAPPNSPTPTQSNRQNEPKSPVRSTQNLQNEPKTPTPQAPPLRAIVGVSNVGLDPNWTGNHLSQANLYGFGRLAWNPHLTARQILDEWTRLTFNSNPKVLETIAAIQLPSWRNFENYTGPYGLQTLTDITGTHYGP
ncbi:MAG: glucosiduronase, partial [Acidobacteriaceae bacterium]|nr:glucosiduronase [Acidobacteriaceae bacterium]